MLSPAVDELLYSLLSCVIHVTDTQIYWKGLRSFAALSSRIAELGIHHVDFVLQSSDVVVP